MIDDLNFPPHMTVARIQRTVANYYHIPELEMVSARKGWEVARPRQVAMYLSKQLTPQSLPSIGRRFGGRDHTTVIHAVKRITQLKSTDTVLAEDVATLTARLAQ